MSKVELEALFEELQIDFSRPGFYDSAHFKAAEKENPAFIEKYAQYVDFLNLSPECLEHARRHVIEATEFMFAELVKDGRRGACIDASGVLQRILDREGIWNYLVGGGVRVQFPDRSGIPDSYFWPIVHPDNPAKTGHAWLRVPPFVVVDITLPLQAYSPRVAKHFDGFIATEKSVPYEPVARDLYEPELVELALEKYGVPPTLRNLAPQLRELMRIFPALGIEYRQLRLKYIPTQISAIDADLEGMRNLCLSGMYPLGLYEKFKQH